MKRNKNFSIETLASNLMILIIIGFIAGTALSQQVTTTRQFNAFNNQARLNAQTSMKLAKEQARLGRQQARYEATQARAQSLWNGIKFLLIFLLNAVLFIALLAAVGSLVFYLVRLARKSTSAYFEFDVKAQHELRLEQEYTKRLAITSQPDRGMFEGMQLNNFTYSPRTADSHNLTQHHKQPKTLNDSVDPYRALDVEFSPVVQLPTFTQALQDAKAINKMILGYSEEGTPKHVSMNEFFSASCSGLSGAGKSSLVASLIYQAVKLYGAKLVICDPHQHDPQSLTQKLKDFGLEKSFICEPSSTSKTMLDSMHLVNDIFTARKEGRADTSYPLIFIAEEYHAITRNKDLASYFTELSTALNEEGRKLSCVCVMVSQHFRCKFTDAHLVAPSHIVMRNTVQNARLQTGLPSSEFPKTLHAFSQGQFLYLSTSGEMEKLQGVQVTQDDLKTLAQSLHGSHSNITVDSLPEVPTLTIESTKNSDQTATEQRPEKVTPSTSQTHLTAQEQLYIKAFIDDGKDASIQAKETTGSTTSKAYKSLRADINEAIKKAMGLRIESSARAQ